ncbi:hypothetical protein DFQ28_010977 [Apophysomyces sp. BC1034]|nr:hypothetical protein DFQ28_010977 [Apophysomyces sp. BC1034]
MRSQRIVPPFGSHSPIESLARFWLTSVRQRTDTRCAVRDAASMIKAPTPLPARLPSLTRRRLLLGAIAAIASGRFGDPVFGDPVQAASANATRGVQRAGRVDGQACVLPFYGINGHVNQGGAYAMPFRQQRALLEDLGIRTYRNDVWDARGARHLAALCDVLDDSGIVVLPCLTALLPSSDSERAAYDTGFSLGRSCATVLKGRVPVYECGNELETTIVRGDGDTPQSYDKHRWPAYRGLLRGMVNGVRHVDPAAKVGVHAGWLHFGALSMLWNGRSPEGLRGDPLRWDVTMYHWYNDMGDIRDAKGIDVLGTLRSAFGRPVCITEFGFRPDGNEAHQANYITNEAFSPFLAVRQRYDIHSAALYELFDMTADNHYGLLDESGRRKKPAYHALKRFIAKHPVT